ncbi:HIT family protein [Streptomyces sp. NPDC058301]|uniref:HIT family protein n=1 Tax=Streptomyces sp. NPDC058301 TaxID=3346436 RepID=UPI0036EE146B
MPFALPLAPKEGLGRIVHRLFDRSGPSGAESGDTVGDGQSVNGTCLFCEQDRPDLNRIMKQNKTFYARYDNFPAAEGHVEIVPKRHVESFFHLTARELRDAYSLIQLAQESISDEHHPDGYTIGINEGRAAGRTIDHLHIHLIPRHYGDVEDPRGGIRKAVPNCEPDEWMPEPSETPAEPAAGRR